MSGVLGVTVGVVAGLLTVALCHYLSNARVPYSMPVGRAQLPLPRRYLRCLVKQLLLELPKPVSVGRRYVLMLSYRRQEP